MTDDLLTPRMKISVALTGLLVLAREMEERPSRMEQATELRAVVNDLYADMKVVLDYIDTQERNIAGIVEESNQRERYVTLLRGALLDVEHTVESATREQGAALDHLTAAFNDLRQLPARITKALTGEFPRPMGANPITIHAPRTAAKGA